MKRLCIILIGMMFFVSSCEKEEVTKNIDSGSQVAYVQSLDYPDNSNQISEKTLDEQHQYSSKNLQTIAGFILSKMDEKDFRGLVYSKVEERFDGDYNVLVIDLINKLENNGAKSPLNAIISSQAFLNIEGKDYYPQIFIPFYEKLKSADIIGEKKPSIIIHVEGQSESLVYNSFELTGKDAGFSKTVIDEDFARNNEVWVVSLNERVHSQDEIYYNKQSTNKSARTVSSDFKYKVQNIKIKVNYESWVAGDSEVCIKGAYSNATMTPNSSMPIGFWAIFPYNGGREIIKLPRNQIGLTQTPNWQIHGPAFTWDTSKYGEYLYYAIYEDDSWPRSYKYEYISSNNPSSTHVVDFRSSDQAYWSGRHHHNFFDTNQQVDNSNITFNIVTQ